MPTSEAAARRALEQLVTKYKDLSPAAREEMTEASVVRQFIDILLRDVLGWPIEDPARYKYEHHTEVGRPDITLIPEAGGTIFLEAKRFGKIQQLREARFTVEGTITPGQLALPGMAVDRTEEEQQAINYAFGNGGTWAILTNFEKLRLFNARRDWLVLSFEKPSAYLDDFDLLWQLSYPNVLNGSLEQLSNQRHTKDIDTTYLAFINEWRLKLAQNLIQRRAENPWAFLPDGSIDLLALRAVVQRFLDRLVIVRFAEDHLVIPPGTLRQFLELRRNNPYTHTLDEFLDQFFRRFDEFHNSALFALGMADEASFSDDVLIPLISKLYEARYRAMPADIMGNTYEQYLGTALALDDGSVTTRDNLETRKKQGSYYTPQVVVQHLVDNSLGRYLYGTANGLPDGEPIEGETRKTSRDIRDLRVLDSACGSGSFLIYAYQVLAQFYESEIERLRNGRQQRALELARAGVDPLRRELELVEYTSELDRIAEYPRLILETHLYGVDLDPQAAEIAVVNLIMRAMERRHRDRHLPLILNQNVKVGNALVGLRPDAPILQACAAELANIRRLRQDLARTPHDPEHDAIRDALERATAELRERFDPLYAEHFSDLERVRPFHWAVEFPEVFVDENGQLLDNPGFDIIVGNPPWEIVKPDLRDFYAQFDPDIKSKLSRQQAERRIEELIAEDPRRAQQWEAAKVLIEESAAYYRASSDYTRQGRGDTATQKLFLERMYDLLRDGGRLGYVVPAGLYRDMGTKELRLMLLDNGNIQYIYSFSNERRFFLGVHHDSRFSLIGVQKGPRSNGFWATFRFNPRMAVAPDDLPSFLADPANLIYVQRTSLEMFSPDSLAMMEFESPRDHIVAEIMHRRGLRIGDVSENSWGLEFGQEFHMANDSHLFNQGGNGLPLYEGKMIHQFDASYLSPRYWIDEKVGKEKLLGTLSADWFKGYRFAFREVSNATNERTCIAAVLPRQTFAGHTLWIGIAPTSDALLYFIAVVNSFCFDWLARFKVDKHVTLFIMKSLPLPRLTAGNCYFDAIVPRAARLTCTRAEFADLWREVMGEEWDESKGATDPDERQQLRDEIDAIVAHLYGLSRDDFNHVLGTFPLVFPDTDEGWQRRQQLLAVYDEWAHRLKD